jgi:hypothetical protein
MASPGTNPLFDGVHSAAKDLWEDFGHRLCTRVFTTISENFGRALAGRPRSKPQKNWAWMAPRATPTTRPEEKLERELVGARGDLSDWCNQVPVASGLVSQRLTRCAIDLVHRRGPRAFDFVELKVGSDSPTYAAVEVLQYGCLWLLSRAAKDVLKYPTAALLDANDVALCVLAPESFYGKDRLRDFQRGLNRALSEISAPHGVALSFRFERFPNWFREGTHTSNPEALRRLLDKRIPIQ